MERGICSIAVLYFALYVLSLTLTTVVGQQGYKCYQSLFLAT